MRRAQLGAAVILAGTIAACADSAPPAGSVRHESLVAAASPTTPETTTLPEVTTTTTKPEPDPTTTTTAYDWGPVLCPRLRHPAHHEPCPVTTVAEAVPAPSRTPASGTGACGGDLPPCWVMNRESGGDPTVWNRQGSGASGKWQFMPGTWGGYGGYSAAAYAPESVQDERARQVWAGGAGCSHWSACG